MALRSQDFRSHWSTTKSMSRNCLRAFQSLSLRVGLFLSVIIAVVYLGALTRPAPTAVKPAIWQVDRILIQSSEPSSLFGFFADRLQLPVAWRLAESAGSKSGGLGAGNVTLEIYSSSGTNGLTTLGQAQARFAGLALQPYPLGESLPELKSRGIRCDPPEPFVSTLPDGSRGTLWTTVVLPQFSKPGLTVFLYEYSPSFLRLEVKRKQLAGQLALRGGGPLGVRSVREITIGAEDLPREMPLWEKLLRPLVPAAPGLMQAGTGPAIHLIANSTGRILQIVLIVESLERATTFLKDNRMLGSASKGGISIDAPDMRGLSIVLAGK